MSTPPPERPDVPGGAVPAQGAPGGPPVVPGETPGKATAALILGLLGLFLCPLILSPLAIIYGNQGKAEIDANPGLGGRGLAQAGVVLGWVGVAFLVVMIVVFVLLALSGSR